MSSITANELKTRGVRAVEEHLDSADEVFVSVRGKDKFVIISVEKYTSLREFELDQAVREAQADYQAGRVVRESADEHMKQMGG